MDRSLRLIEEARQALKNPESPNNTSNLTHVAKDVSQVRWIYYFFDTVFSVYVSRVGWDCRERERGGGCLISISLSIASVTGV